MGSILQENDIYTYTYGGDNLLFHIPSGSIFSLSAAAAGTIEMLRSSHNGATESVDNEILADLTRLGVVRETLDGMAEVYDIKNKIKPPLQALVLNVNTGCNLACHYCYKEDLTTPAQGKKMAVATALKSVDMLMKESGSQPVVNLVFFGGEPLSNMPVIRETVDYANTQAAALGKRVDYSITTNATLLTEDITEFFSANNFSVTVSIDGPAAVHDKNRITVSGRGTYKTVAKKLELLLASTISRRVTARVTLTRGITDVVSLFEHLHDELGIPSVGFSPVTSSDLKKVALENDELQEIYRNMQRLGKRYREAALRGEVMGFTNMEQTLRSLYEGSQKQVPCGAGLNLLAVDMAGDLNLCHRFTGSDMQTFGNVDEGFDKQTRDQFVAEAADRTGRGCTTCWIRNICSGGCYHESYTLYDDPFHPTYHHCDLLRDWIQYNLMVYTEIYLKNPGFFRRFKP